MLPLSIYFLVKKAEQLNEHLAVFDICTTRKVVIGYHIFNKLLLNGKAPSDSYFLINSGFKTVT
jgi:hypothetical protein